MKKTTFYISGKVTGESIKKTRQKFEMFEKLLMHLGLDCVNPIKLGIETDANWDDAMEVCLNAQNEKCNAILLLHDWNESKGARMEFENAVAKSHAVYFSNNLNQIVFDVEHNIIY